MERLWPEFGHSLRVLAAMRGGMGWRTVDGVEYLTRYTQEDGKKGRSLGRRSPETEAQMAHFENTVLKARRIRWEYPEDVLLTCKLAKAHGIARLAWPVRGERVTGQQRLNPRAAPDPELVFEWDQYWFNHAKDGL
jgi:hypothetical protein